MDNEVRGDGFSEGTVSTDFFGFRTHEVREVEKEKAALRLSTYMTKVRDDPKMSFSTGKIVLCIDTE